jgi:hypothetical protein
LVTLVGCQRSDPGISRERAEAILRGFGFVNINLGPTIDGWTGFADRGRNTYRMVVHVDNDGGFRIRPARRFRRFGYM